MSDMLKIFTEVDKISQMRLKLTKGVKIVFCKIARGRIGWDIYKATLSFRKHNRHLFLIADKSVSDSELEEFLLDQHIRI
jgi:hypothetical protein